MQNNKYIIYSLLFLLIFLELSTLCMNNDPALLLDESRIVTPNPTKRGLGVAWTLDTWVRVTKENKLLEDLETGYFDPDNSSYHRVFDDSIDAFVDNQEHNKLAKVLILAGSQYAKQIKPSDIPSCKAHIYLTHVHNEKLKTLEKDVTEINKKHLQQLNDLFTKIQNHSTILTTEAQKIVTDYKNDKGTLIQTSCNDIKKSKVALCDTHETNGTFLVDVSSYCSDYESEEDEKDTSSKNQHGGIIHDQRAIKNPDDIELFYNNEHILEKIETNHKNEDTLQLLEARLAEIYAINEMIKKLGHLTYIDDEKK